MDVALIRGAGLRVLQRRRFRARSCLSVPEPTPGLHSVSTCLVDLDRELCLLSTRTSWDPEPGEEPDLSRPVVLWSTRDGLLVPLPSDGEADPLWACVPGEPLLAGPLAMLLWLVGAVSARPTPSGAAWLVVVDADRAVQDVPPEHRAALRTFLHESGQAAGSRLQLEVRLSGDALEAVDAELPGVPGGSPRALLHLAVDAGPPPDVPEPPVAGTVADPDEIARAWASDWPDDLPVRRPRG